MNTRGRYPEAPKDWKELEVKWNDLVRTLDFQSVIMSQNKILRTNIKYTDTDFNLDEEGILLVNASVSTRTIYLKNARNCKENIYWIKRTDSNASNHVIIKAPSGETVEASVEVTIDPMNCKAIVSDGENYWVISKFFP